MKTFPAKLLIGNTQAASKRPNPRRRASSKRELNVTDARVIPRMEELRKREMLEVFAQGFFAALAELAAGPVTTESGDATENIRDPRQPDLYD